MACGDSSRPSSVVTLPLAVRMTMNPPPPMPQENGSVTPSTPAATTAASTALPPRSSSAIAALVASTSTGAAAPPVPRAVGVFGGSWASAGATPSRAVSPATTIAGRSGKRVIGPPYPRIRRRTRDDSEPDAQQRGLDRVAGQLAQAGHVGEAAAEGRAPQRVLHARPRPGREVALRAVAVLVAGLVARVAPPGRDGAVDRPVPARRA